MFNQGLSLDQAPPISVPFRFFLTAPIFGVLLGILFLVSPYENITNQYSPVAVGAVHLFTLGILAMIIFGAMQQMMPVLAGAVIRKARLFANVVHSSLVLGTLSFCTYFIFEVKMALHIGVLFLAISFLIFFLVAIRLLFKVEFLTSTVKAMRLFSLSGLITLCLGLFLGISYMSSNISDYHYAIVNLHILFGIFGFAVLLIMGVSFQVIPMFYVALDFPKYIQNKVPLVIFSLFFISAFILLLDINFLVLKIVFTGLFSLFCFYGLKSLNNRRRPVFDVTLWYWKLSLVMFMLSLVLWLFNFFDSNYLVSVIFAIGFLYSLLQGMVYKIIPFMSWFHLSSKGYFKLPTIREFIDEKHIKYHFFIHVASLIFFILSAFISFAINIAAILFIVSNVFFLVNCIGAVLKYKEVSKTDPMDMSAFK